MNFGIGNNPEINKISGIPSEFSAPSAAGIASPPKNAGQTSDPAAVLRNSREFIQKGNIPQDLNDAAKLTLEGKIITINHPPAGGKTLDSPIVATFLNCVLRQFPEK